METKQTVVEWLVEQIKSDQNQKALSANDWMQVIEQAKEMEYQQLEAAFKAGWMRANATNYDDSYFQHFLSENYDNN